MADAEAIHGRPPEASAGHPPPALRGVSGIISRSGASVLGEASVLHRSLLTARRLRSPAGSAVEAGNHATHKLAPVWCGLRERLRVQVHDSPRPSPGGSLPHDL